MEKKLVLASTSKARVEILDDYGIKYDLIPNTLDEEKEKLDLKDSQILSLEQITTYVKRLSLLKGKTVVDKVNNSIIISADTVVYFENEILEKPKTEDEASKMLNKLSDKVHKVITGVALIDTDSLEVINYVCVTDIKMKKIDDSLIEHLVNLDDTYAHAGGYNISGVLSSHIDILNGDYDNAKGLPLQKILKTLESSNWYVSEGQVK